MERNGRPSPARLAVSLLRTTDQSDAGSAGIFSRRTNLTCAFASSAGRRARAGSCKSRTRPRSSSSGGSWTASSACEGPY
eukprot:7107362-Pyramimonas_sp.AAC.1